MICPIRSRHWKKLCPFNWCLWGEIIPRLLVSVGEIVPQGQSKGLPVAPGRSW
ncbi:unnamed protein product [Staurois parvus]|uniref:Uncharacterized protein n=1 Tax=Staurois parvus TaxID=386267 RepID=A0ABN9BVK8_9NEOB|nr:unnamed protein product [Staurois parvus]